MSNDTAVSSSRKHLYTEAEIARARANSPAEGDARHTGSIGMKVHAVYVALVSVLALGMVIAIIALASGMA